MFTAPICSNGLNGIKWLPSIQGLPVTTLDIGAEVLQVAVANEVSTYVIGTLMPESLYLCMKFQ